MIWVLDSICTKCISLHVINGLIGAIWAISHQLKQHNVAEDRGPFY